MKKSTLIANVAVWLAVLAVCGGFLVWYQSGDTVANFATVGSSPVLQYLFVVGGAFVAFSAGSLVGTLAAWFGRLRLGRGLRLAFRIVSVALLVMMAACPLLLSALPSSLQLVLAVVLFVGLRLPLIFLVAGALLGLGMAGLAPEPPADPQPLASDEEW